MPSRHSKKAWRKPTESSIAIEEGLAEATHRQRHGTDFAAKDNTDLFFEDKTPKEGRESGAVSATAPPAKQRKLLKSEAILMAGRTAAPIQTPHVRQRQKTKKRGQQPANGQQAVAKRGASEAADLWDADEGAGSKRRRTSKGIGLQVRGVEIDMPGCSYNPDVQQHQDAVAMAVAAEVQKGIADGLKPKAPPPVAEGPAQQDELAMLQVDDDGGDGPEQEGAAEAAEGTADRRLPERKTKTQRNREQRRRQASAQAQAQRRLKATHAAISQLPELTAELDQQQQAQQAAARRRQANLADKQASQPPRLSKTPFKPEPLQVLLSEELHGSLRSLKSAPTLTRERFNSLQARGIIEPRTRSNTKTGKRVAFSY